MERHQDRCRSPEVLVHLLVQFPGVDPPPPAVVDITGQGMELIDLEQSAPDATSQLGFRHVLQYELGFKDPS